MLPGGNIAFVDTVRDTLARNREGKHANQLAQCMGTIFLGFGHRNACPDNGCLKSDRG